MAVVSMSYLLEAGVHFGHQTKRWNPKMKEYIYTSRDDIYIIDLQKTAKKIDEAYTALKEIVANGGKVLFVGTRKQAQEAIKEEAIRSNSYYVTERWLGGTLTNFKTIRRRIRRLEEIEKMEADGTFDLLPKKEVIGLKKEYAKLDNLLCGIREMNKLPQAIYIVDPSKEEIAIREARKLNIPVFGIVDTNCDPDMVDYVIPANDDAIRAVKLITSVMANAIIEANGGEIIDYSSDKNKEENATEVMQKALETVKRKEKQAQEAIKEEAIRSNSYYVTERWLGGTLTNFKTIRRRIRRLEEIEKMEADGTFDLLPKKEVIGLKKEYAKLDNLLCGIREMNKLPQAIYIVDPSKEEIAIREARKLNIPVFGIVDTNCDPDMVDYVIPANDDAIRAVKLITSVMANAIIEANGGEIIDYSSDKNKEENATEVMQKALETVKRKEERPKKENRNFKKPFAKKEFKKEVKETEEVKAVKEDKKVEEKKEETKLESLDSMTVAELRELAKEKEIKGYSTMKKAELLEALK